MADDNRNQERTEQPTPKRLKQAREQGQVPRSRELNTMTLTVSGAVAIIAMGEEMLRGLYGLLRDGWSLDRATVLDPAAGPGLFAKGVLDGLWMISPVLIVLFLAALLGPILIGGWSFSPKAVAFKWSKLDPVKGLSRIFSAKGLMELVKTLAKFAVVCAASGALLWMLAGDLLGLGGGSLRQSLSDTAWLLSWSFLALSSVLVLIAAVDIPFQLWDHRRQLRMTRQEVKDELKETEGRPEVRSRIRGLQREMAQRRMMEEVPKADVVIVNPTHFAVALKFDDGMSAPRVVAKGADRVAMRIRQLAGEHEVTIFSAPPLARALYFNTEIGQEIPAGLYMAVAQVLAYVYQLRSTDELADHLPVPPSDLPVPKEFRATPTGRP